MSINSIYAIENFNTSHVNVNRIVTHYIRSHRSNFNTSHVNVNHITYALIAYISQFQYISC